jgi:hypothetical protein
MMEKTKSTKYSDNLETLVALTTHLAMTEYKSRTPSALSEYLSLDYGDVLFVLKHFKGLFRESLGRSKKYKEPDGTPEHQYWLQLRYARWYLEGKNEDEDSEEKSKPEPPLDPEYLIALLDFITKMVDQEKAQARQ